MEIITLIENQRQDNRLKCEHGLSFWLKKNGRSLVFDLGQSEKVFYNAQQLGVDLRDVEKVILSHGHYDHTGGLPHFMDKNGEAKVYLHPAAFKVRFSRSSVMIKENGIPWKENKSDYIDQLTLISECTEIMPDVWIMPIESRVPGYDQLNERLVIKDETGEYVPDHFEDELIMVVREGDKIVVFCGCAHNGIVSILAQVKETLGFDHFHLVAGGLHLKGQPEETVQYVLDGLKPFSVEKWALNHCTGDEAFESFSKQYPDQVFQCHGGAVFNI